MKDIGTAMAISIAGNMERDRKGELYLLTRAKAEADPNKGMIAPHMLARMTLKVTYVLGGPD